MWLAFCLAGLVTFAQRSLFFWLSDGASRRLLPESLKRALRYVAPAAFAAIAVPRVVQSELGGAEVSAGSVAAQLVEVLVDVVVDARFLAALAASVVMWRVGRLPVMLVVGMSLFWLLRAVGL